VSGPPKPPGSPGEERPTLPHQRRRHGIVGPFTGSQLLAAAGAVALVAVVLAAVTAPIPGPDASPAPPDPQATQYAIGSAGEGLAPGDRAPELQLTTASGTARPVQAVDGRTISLADLRGKVVWIDFWASWCPPCREETPILRDLYARYRDRGLEIVAISVQESTADDVRRYAETYGLGYPIVADLTGELFRAWRVYGLPTQLFIGRDGVIRRVVQGPVDEAGASAIIESLLGTPGSDGGASPDDAAAGIQPTASP
jgi:thiol-disulfide isomerase/thioredoxin